MNGFIIDGSRQTAIGSAVLAHYTRETNTQSHRPYGTCDVCSDRPHLCYACDCSL